MTSIKTDVIFIGFQIQNKQTICIVEFSTKKERTPWGKKRRLKAFPSEKSMIDIIQEDIVTQDFLLWNI